MFSVEDGLTLLDVQSSISDSEFSRTFSMSDSTSFGLRAVWSQITLDDVTVAGWNDGIRCESACTITGTSVNAGDGGRNSGSALTCDGGSISFKASKLRLPMSASTSLMVKFTSRIGRLTWLIEPMASVGQ